VGRVAERFQLRNLIRLFLGSSITRGVTVAIIIIIIIISDSDSSMLTRQFLRRMSPHVLGQVISQFGPVLMRLERIERRFVACTALKPQLRPARIAGVDWTAEDIELAKENQSLAEANEVYLSQLSVLKTQFQIVQEAEKKSNERIITLTQALREFKRGGPDPRPARALSLGAVQNRTTRPASFAAPSRPASLSGGCLPRESSGCITMATVAEHKMVPFTRDEASGLWMLARYAHTRDYPFSLFVRDVWHVVQRNHN
jgi:hypothetical protein